MVWNVMDDTDELKPPKEEDEEDETTLAYRSSRCRNVNGLWLCRT